MQRTPGKTLEILFTSHGNFFFTFDTLIVCIFKLLAYLCIASCDNSHFLIIS